MLITKRTLDLYLSSIHVTPATQKNLVGKVVAELPLHYCHTCGTSHVPGDVILDVDQEWYIYGRTIVSTRILVLCTRHAWEIKNARNTLAWRPVAELHRANGLSGDVWELDLPTRG